MVARGRNLGARSFTELLQRVFQPFLESRMIEWQGKDLGCMKALLDSLGQKMCQMFTRRTAKVDADQYPASICVKLRQTVRVAFDFRAALIGI